MYGIRRQHYSDIHFALYAIQAVYRYDLASCIAYSAMGEISCMMQLYCAIQFEFSVLQNVSKQR